jgi:hypothetical protein
MKENNYLPDGFVVRIKWQKTHNEIKIVSGPQLVLNEV